MALKTLFPLWIVSVILIVVAFFLGRFTATRSGVEDARPVVGSGRHDSPSTAKAAIPPGQQVIGFIDMIHGRPVVQATRDGEVQLSGWAACVDGDSHLTKVEILVENKIKAGESAFYARSDVSVAYDRPDFKNSGWKTSFSAHGMQIGEYPLKALATCSKGEVAALPVFNLNITNE